MPDIIQFKNGNQIKNTYDASGRKLGTEYFTQLTNLSPLADGQIISQNYLPGIVNQDGTAYIGNFEYNTLNGNASQTTLSRIYNDEGYVENLVSPNYYYYRKDHLGDNREVWCANTNTTEQRTQYYPSGLPWASNDGDNPGKQQRKYNGKEFVEMHGYDTYDYGARGYYPAVGSFPTVDPLAEMKPWQSPYMYCSGNPINRTDPTGMVDGIPDQTIHEVTITGHDGSKNNSNTSPSVQFIDYVNKNIPQIPRITPPKPSFNSAKNTNNIVKTTNKKESKSENEELLNTLNTFLATVTLNLETKELITKYVMNAAKLGKGAEALGKVCNAFGKMSPWLTGSLSMAKILNNPSTTNWVAGFGNTGISLLGPEISWISTAGDLTGVSDKAYTRIGNYIDYGAYNSYVNFNQYIQNMVYSLISGQ